MAKKVSGQIDTRIYLVLLITAMAMMRVVKLSGRHFAWNAIPASLSQDITVDSTTILGPQSRETLPFPSKESMPMLGRLFAS